MGIPAKGEEKSTATLVTSVGNKSCEQKADVKAREYKNLGQGLSYGTGLLLSGCKFVKFVKLD